MEAQIFRIAWPAYWELDSCPFETTLLKFWVPTMGSLTFHPIRLGLDESHNYPKFHKQMNQNLDWIQGSKYRTRSRTQEGQSPRRIDWVQVQLGQVLVGIHIGQDQVQVDSTESTLTRPIFKTLIEGKAQRCLWDKPKSPVIVKNLEAFIPNTSI